MKIIAFTSGAVAVLAIMVVAVKYAGDAYTSSEARSDWDMWQRGAAGSNGTVYWRPVKETQLQEQVSSAAACDVAALGDAVSVAGMIAEVQRLEVGTYFLRVGAPYPNQCMTAVIFRNALHLFPQDLRGAYEGKHAVVRGPVTQYHGKPQIILEDPSQITIVDHDSP